MLRPKPGAAVRGSTTGRPVMALLDLLGRRWALRILWELREPATTFRELQARCGDISSSVLSQRLKELRHAGAIDGFTLTKEGERLIEALQPLDAWAKRWEKRS